MVIEQVEQELGFSTASDPCYDLDGFRMHFGNYPFKVTVSSDLHGVLRK